MDEKDWEEKFYREVSYKTHGKQEIWTQYVKPALKQERDAAYKEGLSVGANKAVDHLIRESQVVPGMPRCWSFQDKAVQEARTIID